MAWNVSSQKTNMKKIGLSQSLARACKVMDLVFWRTFDEAPVTLRSHGSSLTRNAACALLVRSTTNENIMFVLICWSVVSLLFECLWASWVIQVQQCLSEHQMFVVCCIYFCTFCNSYQIRLFWSTRSFANVCSELLGGFVGFQIVCVICWRWYVDHMCRSIEIFYAMIDFG